MRLILLFFFLLSFSFAKEFRVATYNVENLFDAIYQGSEYPQYVPRKHGWNEEMVEKKIDNISEVICDLNADIIGLQEVENDTILKRLQEKLKIVGCNYPYRAITSKKNATIQVALLSRYPIVSQYEIVVSPHPRVRNILEVDIAIDQVPLRIFVNHWKSKADGAKESKRIASAKALLERIEATKGEYIIIGDLNSPYDIHRTLEPKHDDSKGLSGLGSLLKTAVDGELVSEDTLLLSDDKNLHYNLWNELPMSQRWNHQFYGDKKTLDHILIPKSMTDKKGIDYVNDSFEVFKPKYLFGRYGGIARWGYKYGKHTGTGYSDHLPLVASFSTNPYVPAKTQDTQIAKEKQIEDLYLQEGIDEDILLRDVVVVFKRGGNVLFKQSPTSRGIYGYQLPKRLKEGHKYDIVVHETKTYFGLKEIAHITILKEKGSSELEAYYSDGILRQNEIFRNIDGVYRNKMLTTKYGTFPIFFKNNIKPPRSGSKIRLLFGHLGYYKQLQWVVYSTKDFKVME